MSSNYQMGLEALGGKEEPLAVLNERNRQFYEIASRIYDRFSEDPSSVLIGKRSRCLRELRGKLPPSWPRLDLTNKHYGLLEMSLPHADDSAFPVVITEMRKLEAEYHELLGKLKPKPKASPQLLLPGLSH